MDEYLEFPVERGITTFSYEHVYPGLRMIRPPNQPTPVQAVSRGYSYWTGTITIGMITEEDTERRRRVGAFINSLEGGLRPFIIPFRCENYSPLEAKEGKHLYPTKDETTDADSVHVTAHAPSTPLATRIGLGAQLTLDTPASPSHGFKRGYFASLHNADKSKHYGLVHARTDQVGDTVLVGPKPPPIPADLTGGFRMDTRTPTLPVQLQDNQDLTIIHDGWFYRPITLQWIQAVSPYG